MKDKVENIFQARTFFRWLSGEIDENYLLTKTCEELTELQELLLKTVNKKAPNKPKVDKIIEEIGDVEFRLDMLKKKLGIDPKLIENRKIYKANQFITYINSGKYSKNI